MKKLRHYVWIIFTLLVITGCSSFTMYFNFWESNREKQKAFSLEPTASLLRDIHPENSFMVAGKVNLKTKYDGPLLVVAVTDKYKKGEIVATRILHQPVVYYQVYLPEGDYVLYVFADIDGNGYFDAHELIGHTSDAPVQVRTEKITDGLTFNGPSLTLDIRKPKTISLPVKVKVKQQDYIVASLEDEFFAPQYGEMGMYDTAKLFAHTQRFMFALEEFDPNKVTVVFVHGVAGTPQDFKYLVNGMDRKRYQPLFYFYPSGMPLQKLGSLLSGIITVLSKEKQFGVKKMIIVAHSMGGLVSLSALNELCLNGAPDYLKGYISFNTPYGGVEMAKKALENAPAVIPAWRDVASNSPFLEKLYQGTSARKIPFYLFFGYETNKSSDGTITLQSQLEHKVQLTAHKVLGFNASHVGILNDNQARQSFYQILDDLARR